MSRGLLTRDLTFVSVEQLLGLGFADAALRARLAVPDSSLAWDQGADAVQQMGCEVEAALLPELLHGEQINQELGFETVVVYRVNLQEFEHLGVDDLAVVLAVHRLSHHLSDSVAV